MRTEILLHARRTPLAHDHVALFATARNVRQRDVRQLEHDASELRLRRSELDLQPRDLFTEGTALRHELVRVLLRLLSTSDFLRRGIAGGLTLFDRLDVQPTLAIQRLGAIDERAKLI